MFDPETIKELKEAIADCIGADQDVLDTLRAEIRPLRNATRRIQPRAPRFMLRCWCSTEQMIPSFRPRTSRRFRRKCAGAMSIGRWFITEARCIVSRIVAPERIIPRVPLTMRRRMSGLGRPCGCSWTSCSNTNRGDPTSRAYQANGGHRSISETVNGRAT